MTFNIRSVQGQLWIPIWIGWRIWIVQILLFNEWNMDWIKAEIKCGSDRRICDRIKDLFLRQLDLPVG